MTAKELYVKRECRFVRRGTLTSGQFLDDRMAKMIVKKKVPVVPLPGGVLSYGAQRN